MASKVSLITKINVNNSEHTLDRQNEKKPCLKKKKKNQNKTKNLIKKKKAKTKQQNKVLLKQEINRGEGADL